MRSALPCATAIPSFITSTRSLMCWMTLRSCEMNRETAVIGDIVRLYQAVTLEARNFATDMEGRLVKGQRATTPPDRRGQRCDLCGAAVLGRITIGHHSVIGGNVWLIESVPPYSTIHRWTRSQYA